MRHLPIERLAAWIRGIPTVEAARADPWRPLPFEPPLRAYGPGASTEFANYLAGTSHVRAGSPGEVAAWLGACRYASDPELYGERDAWLHPMTFELVRSGDCEDFALWGWRKLVELGLDAHFVVGLRRRPGHQPQRHAWVVVQAPGDAFILDGVEADEALRPLMRARLDYEPQVGVTPVAARYAFAGLFLSEWGRRLSLRRTRRPTAG